LDYWYSTGAAEAIFVPTEGNLYYYTMEETVYTQFDMSMNWNNGNGLNSGSITDNSLGLTIVFPKNISTANEIALNADGTMNTSTARWNWWPQVSATQNQAATEVNPGPGSYSWHLEWEAGSGPKFYYFTVKDLAGPGLNVQYEVEFAQGGGSGAIAGGQVIVSNDYFQKTYNNTNPANGGNPAIDPFYWNGIPPASPQQPTITLPLDVIGQIKLMSGEPPTFTLTIEKEYGTDDLHGKWGLDDNSVFYVSIQDATTKNYLVFTDVDPNTGATLAAGTLAYDGQTTVMTLIPFSVALPATLLYVPSVDINDPISETAFGPISYIVTEYMLSFPVGAQNIIPVYTVDGGTPEASGDGVEISPDATITSMLVTITNAFMTQPTLVLTIIKELEGYPDDWGITDSTEFDVVIHDVTAGNNLLFVSPATAAAAPAADRPTWHANTYYCVGNDGADSGGTWVFSDPAPYWQTLYATDPTSILTSIPINALGPAVGVSNLWESIYELRELARSDGGGPPGPPSDTNDLWQAYYVFEDRGKVFPPTSQQVDLAIGSLYVAQVINYFQHGESVISLSKELQGDPQDWGVDDDTEFTVRVRDMASNTRLLFDPDSLLSDGAWAHVGSIDSNNNRTLDDLFWRGDINDAIEALPISVNDSPVMLANIFTGAGRNYMIDELNKNKAYSVRILLGSTDITGSRPPGGIVFSPYPFNEPDITIVNTYRVPGGGGGGGGGGGDGDGGGGQGEGGGSGGRGEGGDVLSANTGDDRNIEGWTASLLLSLFGLIIIPVLRRLKVL